MSRAWRLSVCLSVCNMWSHSATKSLGLIIQDRSVSWLPACRSRPALWYRMIPNSGDKYKWDMEKCGVLHFGGNNLRNGGSCALGHCTALINYIRRIEWYQLLAPLVTGSAQNCLRNSSHSANHGHKQTLQPCWPLSWVISM